MEAENQESIDQGVLQALQVASSTQEPLHYQAMKIAEAVFRSLRADDGKLIRFYF